MIIYTLFSIISYALYLFDFCLLIRAVCSWIPQARETRVYYFFFKITEPVLRPVRDVFMRWEFARRCPIDLSFIAVIILISIAQRLLSVLLFIIY
ncbi:MAG: YggT family protein [Clostridia bacterium]|nr:YggT family protein [Clostridia bacterium]